MEWFEDDYNEVFTEPSKADEIISKAVDDLSAFLTDTAKAAISEALDAERKQKEASDELKKTEREIEYAKNKLLDIEGRIEYALKREDETEIRDIPRKYLSRMVREAIGSYAPGDKVWGFNPVTNRIKCPLCHGEKKVDATINGNVTRIKCPDCNGYGFNLKTQYHVKETKIKEIRLTLCFNEERAMYWNHENIYLYGFEQSIPLDSIFATREEAEKALEKIEKEK